MMGVAHLVHQAGNGSPAAALPLVAMWFAMMAVMMTPAAWPWVVAFRRFSVHARSASGGAAATAAFIGGYGIAWLLFSVAATITQIAWTLATGLSADRGLPAVVGAVVLTGAGLVQFSPLKRACLKHCRNPLSFLLTRWRDGPLPAWRIGFGHGLFCVGCCWALMTTTLAVGMTNMWWMLALTVATFAEQVTRRGDVVRVGTGIALVAAGCARALF